MRGVQEILLQIKLNNLMLSKKTVCLAWNQGGWSFFGGRTLQTFQFLIHINTFKALTCLTLLLYIEIPAFWYKVKVTVFCETSSHLFSSQWLLPHIRSHFLAGRLLGVIVLGLEFYNFFSKNSAPLMKNQDLWFIWCPIIFDPRLSKESYFGLTY